MANPSPSWDTVPIFGTWRNLNGTPKQGSIKFSVTDRIYVVSDDVIFPGNGVLSFPLDGNGSILTEFPATDDPDIFPQGWSVKVEEKFTDNSGLTYYIAPKMADIATGGVNLRKVVVPEGSPSVPPTAIIAAIESATVSTAADAATATQAAADAEDAATSATASATSASQSAADAQAYALDTLQPPVITILGEGDTRPDPYKPNNFLLRNEGSFVNLVTNPAGRKTSGTVTVRTNLITNPSFEVDLSGWSSGSSVTVTRVARSSFIPGGFAAQLVRNTSTSGNAFIRTGAVANLGVGTYTWSFYIRATSGSPTYQTFIAVTSGAATNTAGTTIQNLSNAWKRVSHTFTVTTAGAFTPTLRDDGSATHLSGETIEVDAMLLEASTIADKYFDGAYPVRARENLCANPNFETDVAGWSSYKAISTYVKDAASVFSGSYGLLATVDGTDVTPRMGYYINDVAAGDVITLSARLRLVSGTGWNSSALPRLLLRGPNKTGGGEWIVDKVQSGLVPDANGWYLCFITGTVGADTNGTLLVNIGFTQNVVVPAGAKFQVDEVLVERSSTPGDYFDGSTQASDEFTYAWTGAANASLSYARSNDFTYVWSGAANASASQQLGTKVSRTDNFTPGVAVYRHSGADETTIRVMRVWNTVQTNLITESTDIVSTETVSISAIVRPQKTVNMQIGARISIDGTYITYIYSPKVLVPADQITELWFTLNPTSVGGDQIRPSVSIDPGSAGDYVDVFTSFAIKGVYDGPYFDGESGVASWDGVPDASTSTLRLPVLSLWDGAVEHWTSPEGLLPLANIDASGTRDGTTYLRGDGTWSTPSGGTNASLLSTGTLDPARIADGTLAVTKLNTAAQNSISSKYTLPAGGIPEADMDNTVRATLDKASADTPIVVIASTDTEPPAGTPSGAVVIKLR